MSSQATHTPSGLSLFPFGLFRLVNLELFACCPQRVPTTQTRFFLVSAGNTTTKRDCLKKCHAEYNEVSKPLFRQSLFGFKKTSIKTNQVYTLSNKSS